MTEETLYSNINHNTEFSELHCYSNFSFLKSASHPEEMVEQAHNLRYQSLAITDECSLAGVVRAWRKVTQLKSTIKLLIGSSFHHDEGTFILLAKDITGYKNLSRFISYCRSSAEKGSYNFNPSWLPEYSDHCIVLYKPNLNTSDLNSSDLNNLDSNISLIKKLKSLNITCYLLNQLDLLNSDLQKNQYINQLSKHLNIHIVASNSALMHEKNKKPLLDTLTAIRLNKTLNEVSNQLHLNSERYLRPISKLKNIHPLIQIKNSQDIANQCLFNLSEIQYQYPNDGIPHPHSAKFYLRQQTWIGANKRYPKGIPKKVKLLIEKELILISELEYEYYFLTVFDITEFAKTQNILHQGRGSAANSVVCYCLFITEVDPTKVNLLFERFISRRRNEPPDIDVDFDNSRREEVIQHLYKKYTRERCAIAATVITYRPKSALRDIGKALGLDLIQLDNVINNFGWRYKGKDWINDIVNQQTSSNHHTLHLFKLLLEQILGFPRHLSQHVGGFILSKAPLNEIVPIENAAMKDRTVIQWDKDDLEFMRLMKVDLLSLGMLSALQKCLDHLSNKQGKPFLLHHIPKEDDPNVYGMLQNADSVGLFQVESRAQMNMLPRLKPNTFYDLVVQVAIVRPGPIHGDMVHPYLKRKHGLEPVQVPLKSMESILSRTYGVPIFQEQVIAIAMMAANFTADEAEELRRSMASWKKQGHMHFFQEKLHSNLKRQGVDTEYIEKLKRQIEGFGEYGFPESHAASFALIAYYSAWMKYYHPAIFCCALLNSQPMGFYPPWQLIQDAQNHGVTVLQTNVNDSVWEHQTTNENNCIQLGFCIIKGFKKEVALKLKNCRPTKGYQSIEQVLSLNNLDKSDVDKLASSHCFRVFNHNRFSNLWTSKGADFYSGIFENELPPSNFFIDSNRIDNIIEDYQSTGVILNDHPMAYLRDKKILQNCHNSKQLDSLGHRSETYVAGIITNRQRPKTSAGVTFVTLEDETGSINLVVWLKTATRQLKELSQAKILKVYGQVDKDQTGGVIHFIAYRMFDISNEIPELQSRSRDYH